MTAIYSTCNAECCVMFSQGVIAVCLQYSSAILHSRQCHIQESKHTCTVQRVHIYNVCMLLDPSLEAV